MLIANDPNFHQCSLFYCQIFFSLSFPLNVVFHIILVCLCLSAGLHKNYPNNVHKMGVGVGNGPKEEPINFGADPNHGVDPGFLFFKLYIF